MAPKSLWTPAQWMIAAYCRRSSLSGPTCARTPQVLSLGVPFLLWELPKRGQSLTSKRLWGQNCWFVLEVTFWSLPQGDTSARQRGFEIRVFSLLGELPKVIEPHLPIYQLYCWKLGPNMWSSPTTKSSNTTVVTAFRVGFREGSLTSQFEIYHSWICLQLSSARGVDNGGVVYTCILYCLRCGYILCIVLQCGYYVLCFSCCSFFFSMWFLYVLCCLWRCYHVICIVYGAITMYSLI